MEKILRHERLVLAAGVGAVILLAWLWLLLGAGTGMSAIEMTRMAGMHGWLMQPAQWSAGYALLMLSMWCVMMVAMMLPSAAPMLLLVARITSKSDRAGTSASLTSSFAAGYLIAWGGFSLVAVIVQWTLESARLLSPMMEVTDRLLGSGILLAAGLWQLTPIKAACLSQCRSPLSFLLGNWRQGRSGALVMGLEHGARCLGCCWVLMALLFFGGVMNLYWVVGLTVYVLLEKTIPHGHWLGRVVGVALIGWSVLVAATP